MRRKKLPWGFDTKTIDRSVRPQDDFYRFANGAWLKKTAIPATESRWGTFIMLRYDTEKRLRKILTELLKKRHRKGTPEQLVADLYRSTVNLESRERAGTKPVESLRTLIRGVSSREELLACISTLHRLGIHPFFAAGVDQDAKKSERYILYLFQGGLGMPDRDYYLENAPEQKRVREAYVLHIKKLLAFIGYTKKESDSMAESVMHIETALAKASMNKVDVRDPEKTYHKKSIRELVLHSPGLSWKRYLAAVGAGRAGEVIVSQPAFFKETERIVKTAPLATVRAYLEFHLINETASILSKKFARENFDFYARTLTGQKKMKPLWRRGLAAVNGNLGEPLGKLYVKRFFTPRAKRKMDELVDHLFAAYEIRIRKLDWMSPATKRKALAKLAMMTRKIGYPSKWKSYQGLEIRPDDFAGNMFRLHDFEHRRSLRKLKRPVDRTEWFMSPQTVNAYFNPGMNEIVFPAAILQAPFFDERADDAVNYGAIGYTIGHEITHSFDDQGSKFDGKGNLKSWWTETDRTRFEKKAAVLAKQFDRYEVAPGIHVNGKLTLGENIADLGGVSIAFDAYMMRLKKTGRKDIDGFSPEQRFFFGCAQGERELARPEFLKTIVTIDPHSPAEFRVNGPFSNLPEFYEAFGVTKRDRLYRAPSERAKIW